jgi:transglutaminase-like putative cysteine protease
MAYVPGATQTKTLAEDALASGKGVCQDHAQAFVAAARVMGYPARYVSGYLMMEETPDQAASHAWAEAHVDGLGWVGFDPANDISPDDRYVHIAYGLDYRMRRRFRVFAPARRRTACSPDHSGAIRILPNLENWIR